MPAKRPDPKPFCKCGCGVRVRLHRNKWVNGHMTRADRGISSEPARRAWAFKVRRRLFQDDIDQLPARITREDLLVVFSRIKMRGYQQGYQAAQRKRRKAA